MKEKVHDFRASGSSGQGWKIFVGRIHLFMKTGGDEEASGVGAYSFEVASQSVRIIFDLSQISRAIERDAKMKYLKSAIQHRNTLESQVAGPNCRVFRHTHGDNSEMIVKGLRFLDAELRTGRLGAVVRDSRLSKTRGEAGDARLCGGGGGWCSIAR